MMKNRLTIFFAYLLLSYYYPTSTLSFFFPNNHVSFKDKQSLTIISNDYLPRTIHYANQNHPSRTERTFNHQQRHNINTVSSSHSPTKTSTITRRSMILSSLFVSLLSLRPAHASSSFRSGGYGREEYTNSFIASRDTNISPKEAYDSINSKYILDPCQIATLQGRDARALDVGAGAGVSTQVLWEMGYKQIEAVDWSGDAWRRFVIEDESAECPESVRFWEMDDERFRELWRNGGGSSDSSVEFVPKQKFDAIVFNFAVNESKAKQFAMEMLTDTGRLLAPVNAMNDYWLRQTYKCYDVSGNSLWSAVVVGAWDVQFQPDVTQDTCQGIWCAPFNGFKKMETRKSR